MKTLNLKYVVALITLLFPVVLSAQSQRETIRMNEGWKFAFGHAADATKDFGCGTEYFNYLTKANSIHNEGPYCQKFDDSQWQDIQLPHDWVTVLGFDAKARSSTSERKIWASTSCSVSTVYSAMLPYGSMASIWAQSPAAMLHRCMM